MTTTTGIMLGQYRPLDSLLHRLDSRSKMIPVTLVLILSLFTQSAWFYIILMGGLIVALLSSGVGVSTVARGLRPILILVGITILYHIIFAERGGEVYFSIWGWELTEVAVNRAAFFSLRLLLFTSIAFLVTLTSSPSELAEGITRLLSPLSYLRLPVAEIGMIVFIAIRFIPVLYEEFRSIRNAQLIRGMDFRGSLIERIRKTTAIIIPVFMAAVQRADELALAMEARGYDGRVARTIYSRSRFGTAEWAFMIGVAAAVVTLWWTTR
jgi:energy-coupling factor transport system permease protein